MIGRSRILAGSAGLRAGSAGLGAVLARPLLSRGAHGASTSGIGAAAGLLRSRAAADPEAWAGGPGGLRSQAARQLSVSATQLRSLRALEEEANRFPDDAHRQQRLMEACNAQKQPHVAVRRFECGAYAADEAVAKEYIRALALSNQLARLSLPQLIASLDASGALARDESARYAAGGVGGGGGGGLGAGASRGTPETPLHIQWHESPRAQFWKLLRSLALTGALVFAAYTLLGEQARGRRRGEGGEREEECRVCCWARAALPRTCPRPFLDLS